MKNLLLVASAMLLLSCSSNEELDTNKLSEEKLVKFESEKRNPSGESLTFKCEGTSYVNPISINPNYPYITDYEVLFWEGVPMHGRNQKYLTHFLADAIWPSVGPFMSITQVFTGYDTQNDFLLAGTGYIQEYTFGQDADNASFYGEMFPGSGPLTLDAANTVFHHFKAIVDQHIAQGHTIEAVHLYATNTLCIQSSRFVRMSLKVKQNW